MSGCLASSPGQASESTEPGRVGQGGARGGGGATQSHILESKDLQDERILGDNLSQRL